MATPENKLAFDGGWEYDPAPESTDHVRIAPRYGLFIDGDFVRPEKGRYFDTVNPATEEVMGQALAMEGYRQKVFLMTKVCARDYRGAKRHLEDSLRRLLQEGRIQSSLRHPNVVGVTDAFRLEPGEIFISPLDLNIEQQKIELPYKPMIRLAMPVADQSIAMTAATPAPAMVRLCIARTLL